MESLAKQANSFFELTLRSKHFAHCDIGFRIVGLEPERFFKMRCGFLEMALYSQSVGQTVLGQAESRIQRQGVLETLDRLVQLTLFGQCRAQIQIRRRIGWLDIDRCAKMLDSSIQVTALGEETSHEVVRSA